MRIHRIPGNPPVKGIIDPHSIIDLWHQSGGQQMAVLIPTCKTRRSFKSLNRALMATICSLVRS